jgi:RND family efflux transporter MFP subunit
MKKNSVKRIQLFFTFLFFGILIGCQSSTIDSESTNAYPVFNPIIKDTIYTKEYIADIHSLQNVEVRARVKGYLESILVDEGATVRAGQVLFKISSSRYKEELLKAKAMLKSVEAEAKLIELELKSTAILVENNVVSKNQLEISQSKLDAANAQIDVAKSNESNASLNLALTEIKAPFDGIINRIPNKVGSLINEDILLTTISNNKEVFAYFNVSEREYLDLLFEKRADKENEANLVLANNLPYSTKGTIETVEGEFDKTTGNIAFRARFKNPDGILKHGSSGKIQLKSDLHSALIIPQKSTFEIQDKIYVYVVDKNNVAHMKMVNPLFRLRFLYILESGSLLPDDKIIYEGIQQIKEGEKIVPELISINKELG